MTISDKDIMLDENSYSLDQGKEDLPCPGRALNAANPGEAMIFQVDPYNYMGDAVHPSGCGRQCLDGPAAEVRR